MKRRTFIKALAGVSVISCGTYVLWPSFDTIAKSIIEEATANLSMEANVVDKFIEAAHREKYWQIFSLPKKEFIKISRLVDNKTISIPYSEKYLQYKNQIVGQFLLSTSYFANKMDESKPVRFVAFYNPYQQACSNPFSAIHYPA